MTKPKVEIIIVKYNQPDYEWHCIQSVIHFTNYPHKLTVFDNWKTKISLTKVWNQLIEKSDCKYVCLLNSDTIVSQDWLSRMMEHFDEETAVISCSTSLAGGNQMLEEYKEKRFEYRWWYNSDVKRIAKEVWEKYKNEIIERDQLSGFCYLFKKSIWRKLGKFNERFTLMGQDSEFNFRARKAGYKLKHIKGVYVHHYGNVSINALDENIAHKERQSARYLYKFYTSEMKILPVKETFEIIKKGIKKKRFAYTRFGDGELLLMGEWKGRVDNHWNSPELRKELEEAFQITDEDYQIGLVGIYEDKFKDKFYEDKLKEFEFAPESLIKPMEIIESYSKRKIYLNPVIFHYYTIAKPELLIKFLKSLKKVLLIGGGHLKKAAELLKADFFEVPDVQAYYKISDFYPIFKKELEKADIIIFGAGVCSKVLIKRIWQEGYNKILLDMGSILNVIARRNITCHRWIKENREQLERFKKLW